MKIRNNKKFKEQNKRKLQQAENKNNNMRTTRMSNLETTY